jgi:hypothetical protein
MKINLMAATDLLKLLAYRSRRQRSNNPLCKAYAVT